MRPRVIGVSALIATWLLGGCSTEDVSEPTTSSTTSHTAVVGDPPTAGAAVDIPDLALEPVEVGLDQPVSAVALPGEGRLLVTERAGRVRLLQVNGSDATVSGPIIDISDHVSTEVERGLLGIALDEDHRALFLSYTNAEGDSRLDRYEIRWDDPDQAGSGTPQIDISTRQNILSVDQPFPNHNGGHIEFGPDGMLYLGLGDGGGAGDPEGNAQNRSSLLGKMLRLDPDAESEDGPFPSENPFVDSPGARGEIWATGLRNPWQFHFDRENGDLWIPDVGQDSFEEINLVTRSQGGAKGANFGWDLFEGTEEFSDPDPAPEGASNGPFTKPVYTYRHDPGCSVTGGVVYRGHAIEGLRGAYLFSDFCDGTIRYLQKTDDKSDSSDSVIRVEQHELGLRVPQPVSFAADSDGEVYVISLGGIHALRLAG